MTVEFVQDKVTKNMVRFTSANGEVTGSLYVRKDTELAKSDCIVVEVSKKGK